MALDEDGCPRLVDAGSPDGYQDSGDQRGGQNPEREPAPAQEHVEQGAQIQAGLDRFDRLGRCLGG